MNVRPTEASTDRAIVLFDGGCPLCRREIAHYRGLKGSAALDWIDVSRSTERVEALGIPVADAMARFHVRDASGHWHTGAWGFAVLWDHLPGYRLASRLLRGLHLLPLVDRAYTLFAAWRLRRRCESGTCSNPAATSAVSSKE